jgi:hypothetical protein
MGGYQTPTLFRNSINKRNVSGQITDLQLFTNEFVSGKSTEKSISAKE